MMRLWWLGLLLIGALLVACSRNEPAQPAASDLDLPLLTLAVVYYERLKEEYRDE